MRIGDIFRQKVSINFMLSALFFLVCMSLDFYVTNTLSQGDFTMEANPVGRLWWQLSGSFRFIEIPLYAAIIILAAYIINIKSKFFPLLWLNLLAFNHLFGFISWLPFGTLNFLYSAVRYDWQLGYAFSAMSIFLSVPLTVIQLLLAKKFKARKY